MLLGSVLVLHAATDHWTGAGGGDFTSPDNWSPSVPGANDTAQFNHPAASQPVLGAASSVGGIDFVTPGGGWTLSGAGQLTLHGAGIGSSGQTSGVNTISVANLILGADTLTTWNIFSLAPASSTPVFNVSSALQLNPSGQLLFKLQRPSGSGLGTLNLTGPITGTSSGGIKFGGSAYNRNTINLSAGASASSYTGPTILSAAVLNFEQLANTGSKSSFGSAGSVMVGDNNSFATANYRGNGGTTDRPWLLGGAGGGGIKNNGTGPIAFTSTARAVTAGSGGSGNRRLELGGLNPGNNTFAGLLTDEGGITGFSKNEAGTWVLANPANSYTGTNKLEGGTLEVSKLDLGGNPSCLGASASSAEHLSFNNATLNYTGSGDTCDRLFQMLGSATLNNNGSGSLTLNNPAAIAQAGTGARTLTLGGTYAGVNTFACSVGDNTAGGTQTSLTKNGATTWLLTGAHSYSGTTTVRAGKLLVNGSLGTGPVLVGPGATLGGNGGTIAGPVTIQSSGTLALGSVVASLTIKNTLIFSPSSACVMKLSKNGSRPSSDVVQGVSILRYDGTLTVTANGVTFAPGDSFQLFKAASYSGAFASIHLPSLGGNLAWNTSGLSSNGTLRVTGSPAIAALPAVTPHEPGNHTKAAPSPRGVTGPADTAPSAGKSNLAMWLIAVALVVLAGVLAWVVILLKRVAQNQTSGPRSSVSFAVEEQAPAPASRPVAAKEFTRDAVERAPATPSDFGAQRSNQATNHSAPKEGFRGELRQVGLQDVIQLQCLNSKSCILEVSDQALHGRVYIEKGEITHATAGTVSGEPALFKLLELVGGEFSFRPYEAPAARTIHGPWLELLLDAARTRDEAATAAQEETGEGFRAADGETENVLTMAGLLQGHPQVKELLVSSDSGEVLHHSGCAAPKERSEVCAGLVRVTQKIAPLLAAGDCKQVELLTEETKSVLMTDQGCNLFVHMERTGSDLPL
jgi:autotransporter-associated beta strand protein